ncbi:MAG: glycosyltransferase [Nitrospira sp.]|nr:glycosyltransferase [Nitrospira sp.]
MGDTRAKRSRTSGFPLDCPYALTQEQSSSCKRQLIRRSLVVIDGGSKDGTVEILKQNSEKIRYWISEPDHGIYHALNKALGQSHGDWVCLLGADDYLWDSQVIEQKAPHLANAFPAVRVGYGQVALVNESGGALGSFGRPWSEMEPVFLTGEALNIHQATFHHRSLFEARGKFVGSFRIAGDYELLLRELRENKVLHVPHLVTAMQHGGVSSHPSSKATAIREIIQARRMHNLAPSFNLVGAWLRAKMGQFCGGGYLQTPDS